MEQLEGIRGKMGAESKGMSVDRSRNVVSSSRKTSRPENKSFNKVSSKEGLLN